MARLTEFVDVTTPFGDRVERQLRDETVGRLTTVDRDGTPQPVPVWFLWDGESILVYSRPNTPKLRNIARTPRVSLNFDGDGHGGDIVVFTGEARIAEIEPPAHQVRPYVAKYSQGFTATGMTAEEFAASYSVAARVTPTRVRGH